MESNHQPQLEEFAVFPKHVGVWQGDWIRLDHNAQETMRFTGLLTQQIIDNQWIQTNHHEFPGGKKVTQNFVGRVTGEGRVTIESSDPPFFNYLMTAQEMGALLVFNIRDKETDHLLATETINLVQPNQRIRTTQSFSIDGEFQGVMLIVEHRVE